MNMETSTAPETVIRLTENAAGEVKSMLQKPENTGKHLRVYVEKGGCSGMQYSMVFDEKRPDDAVNEWHGQQVLVDPFSAKYLPARWWILATALPPEVSKLPTQTRSKAAVVGNPLRPRQARIA